MLSKRQTTYKEFDFMNYNILQDVI